MKSPPVDYAAHVSALFNHVWGAAPDPAAEYDRYCKEREEVAAREKERKESALHNVRHEFQKADQRKCEELAFEVVDSFDVMARCFSAILNDQTDEVLEIITGELDAAIHSKAGVRTARCAGCRWTPTPPSPTTPMRTTASMPRRGFPSGRSAVRSTSTGRPINEPLVP